MIGEKIRQLRKQNKLSVRELANKVGTSERTIYNYEENISSPTMKSLQRLAEILNIEVKDLFN